MPADFVWMAEVYWDMEARLQALGFDFTYDKRLYDRMRAGNAADIRAHLAADLGYQSRLARFIENHDEPRSVQAFGRGRVAALATMIATLPGLRFFHDGQFEGKSIHLPMPLSAAEDELPDRELAAQYATLLASADEPLFHAGEWKLLEVDADDDSHCGLVAYRWCAADAYALCVVNIGATRAHGRVRIAAELPTAAGYRLDDRLDGVVYERARSELLAQGLYVQLEGYRAHLFRITALPG